MPLSHMGQGLLDSIFCYTCLSDKSEWYRGKSASVYRDRGFFSALSKVKEGFI